MDNKTTSRGLPVVSDATLQALRSRYGGRRRGEATDWGSHLEEVKQRMIEENPNLVKFIEGQVGAMFPIADHNKVFEVLVAMYAVLEWQAEANTLDANTLERD